MKTALWILPLVLAVCLALWLVKAGVEISGLRSEVEDTRKQMAEMGERGERSGPGAESGAETGDEKGGGPAKARVFTQDDRVNWRGVSAIMKAMMDGDDSFHDQRAFDMLHAKLDAMDGAGLKAALDEIGALDLSQEEKSTLEALVVERLIAKDPQGVLVRFDDRIGNDDDQVGWILSEAVGHWARKDPLSAARWMDEKIKEGKFESKSLDGYSESRVEYESVLMASLLGVQNMQAVARVRALPESDRLVVLEQMDLSAMSSDAQVAYADIVRTLVPEADREGAFGYVASELVYQGGYEAVQEFLDRVKASPEERVEAAKEAASGKIMEIVEDGRPTAADIEAMRAWVMTQAPEQVDRITGDSIGQAYDREGNLGFEEAKKLVMDFHAKSGSDELLIGFVSSFAGQENPEEARKLAEMIKDPVRRQQILEGLQ